MRGLGSEVAADSLTGQPLSQARQGFSGHHLEVRTEECDLVWPLSHLI